MELNKLPLRLSLASAIFVVFGLIHFRPYIRQKLRRLLGWSRAISSQDQSHDANITAVIFSHIYKHHLWGINTVPNTPFFSGPGSHDKEIVKPYVSAVRSFIRDTFTKPPVAVDLGCGDFNVGKQIRESTDQYIACDIVSEMIDYNRLAYAAEDVDFRVLDMISEDPPAGDVVFVRQVLQHLSNDQISRFLPKLYSFRWAIVTEHIPLEDPFAPNYDIGTGGVRLMVGSGVELTKAPFKLVHYNSAVLCEVRSMNARIRTIAYQLQET